jgi:hypothetical protein
MARSSKSFAFLAIGTFILVLGGIVSAVGAFRSVMHDPKDKGPYLNTDVAQSSLYNFRHYVAVASYFPEIFNCGKLKDLHAEIQSDPELYIPDLDTRTATAFYCWRESGDAVWLYAFGFVVLFVYLAVAFIAAFRASGQSAAIAGVGLSSVILLWAVLTIVHYQEHNNIPRVLNAFGDCDAFATNQQSRNEYHPWTSANRLVKSDFGLEVLPNYNPTHLVGTPGTVGAEATATRAFYFTGRGGTDLFDETVTRVSATNPVQVPPVLPVLTNVQQIAATVAPTVVPAVVDPNAVLVAPVLPRRLLTTNHGLADDVSGNTYNFDFNRSPARIFGPTPRRSWLCNDDWKYDGTFRVSQNLVYGGLATVVVGALIVLVAFGYIAHPILGVIKAPKAEIVAQRSSNLAREFSDEISIYGDYSTDY